MVHFEPLVFQNEPILKIPFSQVTKRATKFLQCTVCRLTAATAFALVLV